MPKRVKKPTRRRPTDVNQLAHLQVQMSTGGVEVEAPKPRLSNELRAYMRALGTRGGKVSGARRMTNLTKEQRQEIASKAARAMWEKRRKNKG